MKPISKLFFLLFLTLWLHKILAAHGEIPDLIPIACDHTLHKDLCINNLESDPESMEAVDVHGLTTVAVKQAALNATNIRNYITKLDEETSDEVVHQCLSDCFQNYEDAIDQLDDCLNALQSKRYEDVVTWVTAAMNDALTCDEGFKDHGRQSPLANLRNLFDPLCSIVLSLTNQLKQ
ncbi:pectinesterase inhibitor 12-like [Juglans microcarpa x Juglans regia]|uniref:pectinesterase inhibitor 12-like n=1 Tax=Juglans microcarpa x Juglans regia TaxID=2249226 RepID=UPI001B7F736C|nr:pectinesterase inhibitor 12-like [Juglans microcarpa x Juglans regia]